MSGVAKCCSMVWAQYSLFKYLDRRGNPGHPSALPGGGVIPEAATVSQRGYGFPTGATPKTRQPR